MLRLLAIIFLLIQNQTYSYGQLNEQDRVAEYHARNHKWPPLKSNYIPQTEGWISNGK